MALAPGARIGIYEITAPLGEGGMGAGYRARDTQLSRDVALKVLPDSFSNDPDRVARFTREAQVLASLDHPNIGRIYGLERCGANQIIVMEMVEGATLEKAPGVKEHLRYRDFPLNENTFHWQSKARTTRDSAEGRRHLDPAAASITPLLFVRERADHRPGVTMGFTYLGPVAPETAEGERPITIEWRLTYPMPPELVEAARIAS